MFSGWGKAAMSFKSNEAMLTVSGRLSRAIFVVAALALVGYGLGAHAQERRDLPPFDAAKAQTLSPEKRAEYEWLLFNEIPPHNAGSFRHVAASTSADAFHGNAEGVAQALVPVNSTYWELEQKIVAQRRQEFLAFIGRATNIDTPIAPKQFSWEIDWDAQQAYCKDIADALFKNRSRLSFPEPDFSQFRDPVDKLLPVLDRAMPSCKTDRWRKDKRYYVGRVLGQQEAAAEGRLSTSPAGNEGERYYASDDGLIRENVRFSTDDIVFHFDGNTPVGCPDLDIAAVDLGDEPYVATSSPGRFTKTILFAVDGKLTIAVFGRRSADPYESQKPFFGANQGFVFAHGLKENLYKYFALTEPESGLVAQGGYSSEDPERGHPYHPYGCFINFDVVPARRD